jgi:putative copper export protein
MDPVRLAVEFLHIAGGAAWLGASLFANLVVIPAILARPLDDRRDLVRALVLGPERVIIAAALIAALTGLVRGIVFGRIDSPAALATPYGAVWLLSIALTVAVFAVGGRLTSPAARRLRDEDSIWQSAEGGAAALLDRLRLGFRLELTGIATILALMVLLPNL